MKRDEHSFHIAAWRCFIMVRRFATLFVCSRYSYILLNLKPFTHLLEF